MKEYGTNVQKLVNHILTVEEKDTRTKYAYILVELMRQVHPNMRDGQDYTTKLWDDLYIMSNFKLDIDSPFAPPSPDAVGKRPKTVPYNTHFLKYKHYGHNIELLIKRAITETNLDDKKALVAHIGKLMKVFYQTWNKEIVDDTLIWEQMREISRNELASVIEEVAGVSSLGHTRNSSRPNNYSAESLNNNRNNNSRNYGRNDTRTGDRNRGSGNGRNDNRGNNNARKR
ncbi:MAG: DUF4290 domain-containing protein [Pseudarcicella sp.]|nr:DUF4290 domain-containing protein [Pseudarcicella sp.]MBP6410835.1 DUF4290 domain-containing protein [Pseudarcicella sp.]